jgi:hypothetical protein
MGCACNPNTPEPMVNLGSEDNRNPNDDGPVVAAKTGNFAMAVNKYFNI